MSYIPFSLRYRPQSFAEIVGQEHVSRTLQNAVGSGRVAHAYLFAGPRGTGKTSTARVLAKALLCERGPTPNPCGECDICQAIVSNRALDVIEIDAASNRGIEQIRELREKARYSPAQARAKVYILDEAHMLTPEAFNALLKTLEEPPAHVYFVLATTELHKVPATIVSRCQVFEFHLISEQRIVEALQAIAAREGVEAEAAALEEIARAARGALRDAQSIFDQAVAYADGPVTVELAREVLGATPRDAVVELLRAMAEGDLSSTVSRLDQLVAAGKDLPQLLQDVMLAVRDMLRVSLGASAGEEWRELAGAAKEIGPDKLVEALRLLGEAERRLRDAAQQQISLELSLAEIARVWAQPSARETARAIVAARTSRTAGENERKRGTQRVPETRALRPTPQDAPAEVREQASSEEKPEIERGFELTPEEVQAQEEEGRESVPTEVRRPPQPAVPKPSPPGSAEELISRWEEVHMQLKRMRRVAVWALLQEGRPVSLDNDVVTVRFDPKWKFHCERISGPYRADVEEALSAVLGRRVRVRCVLGDMPIRTTPQPLRVPAEATQARLPSAAEEQTTGKIASTLSSSFRAEEQQTEASEEQCIGDKAQLELPEATRQEDHTRRAVELTLELFEGSEELPEE